MNSSRQRLLFVSNDASRTGAPMVLLHLFKWLRKNCEHEVSIILRYDGPLTPQFRALGETLVLQNESRRGFRRIRRLVTRIKNRFGRSCPAIPRAWRERRWDLIYANTLINGELIAQLRKDIPVVTHVHELHYWIERAGANNWKLVKERSARFIAASQAVKTALTDRLSVAADVVEVVHEFVPMPESNLMQREEIRSGLQIPSDAFVVGGSGFESWRKGQDLFVQLACLMRRKFPEIDLHFVWVGRAENELTKYSLDHDARTGGVADRVHWTGEVSDPAPYFAEFDVFAMVSREDPFPLVCLEAASLEKPILCFSEAGGMPEFVEDDAGYVVPYLDLEAMAERIAQLAADKNLVRQLGLRGREKVLARHTVNHAGPKILAIIEEELRAKRRREPSAVVSAQTVSA